MKFIAALAPVILFLTTTGALVLHHASANAPQAIQSQNTNAPVAWGKPDKNLRLGLRLVTESPLHFELLLKNTGDKDTVLNVGTMLGNGLTQYPDAITLAATNSAGKTVTFTLAPYHVGGRMDPFVVPLPAGATYSLSAPWDHYAPQPLGIKLPDGQYQFTATFEGKAVVGNPNNDMGGLTFMPYWIGNIKSGSVQCTLHTPPPRN